MLFVFALVIFSVFIFVNFLEDAIKTDKSFVSKQKTQKKQNAKLYSNLRNVNNHK